MRQFKCFYTVYPANFLLFSLLLLVFLIISFPVNAADKPLLTLAEAERIALLNDPRVAFNRARADAFAEEAIADGQIADPKLTVGLFNVPTDNFNLDDYPTTQFRLGIKQDLPRGDTLRYKSLKRRDYSQAETARALLVGSKIKRDVRLNFLETFYQQQVADILFSSRHQFSRLLRNTEDSYSVGSSNQQAVLLAKLELSRLDARIIQTQNKMQASKALLSKWLPNVMQKNLAAELPEFVVLDNREQLQTLLVNHPLIAIDNANINAAKQSVSIAKEQYKPSWNVGIEYRKRFGEEATGRDRVDMLAAMVTVDMPLFTDKRQDRRLSASQYQAQAAKLIRVDHLRGLQQQLNRYFVDWQQQVQQEVLYQQHLLKNAKNNTQAALSAYRNRVVPFSMLIQAQIVEFETRIQYQRVQVDRTKAQVQLLYLTESSSSVVVSKGVNDE